MARERELLKQIECLTKEMTEARNETDKYKVLAAKAEAATEKLQGKLEEERSEADAIQKKLIADLRDAKAKLAEAQAANALLQVRLEGLVFRGKGLGGWSPVEPEAAGALLQVRLQGLGFRITSAAGGRVRRARVRARKRSGDTNALQERGFQCVAKAAVVFVAGLAQV